MSGQHTKFTNGWVPINRNVMELPDYFSQPFTLAMCLIDLNLIAEWKPRRSFCLRGRTTVLERGQVAISLANLAKRWHLSKPTVLKRLNDLESYGLIYIEPTPTCTIITLRQYTDSEQDDECEGVDDFTQDLPESLPESLPDALPPSTTESLPGALPEYLHNTLTRKKEKEKEKGKMSFSSSSLEREGGEEEVDSIAVFNYFFAERRRNEIEAICREWSLDLDQLKWLADECLLEWDITGKDYSKVNMVGLSRQLYRHMQSKHQHLNHSRQQQPGTAPYNH